MKGIIIIVFIAGVIFLGIKHLEKETGEEMPAGWKVFLFCVWPYTFVISFFGLIREYILAPAGKAFVWTFPSLGPVNYDTTHPYCEAEVIEKVNEAIKGSGKMYPHDLKSVKQVYDIENDDLFCHRPKPSLTPQYSQDFVNWLVERIDANREFFADVREKAIDRAH